MKFTSFNLKPEILATLKRIGFENLSPIQEQTLAITLKGESLVAKAPTGSGKTHSFLLPAINRIDIDTDATQVLIIVPTVELGRQTIDFIKDFTEELPSLTYKFLEDVDGKSKIKSQVIVTTPFKLRKLDQGTGTLNLNDLKTIILDEADMLSTPDFFDDIDSIVSSINRKVQFLIFSATYNQELQHQLKKYVGDTKIISIKQHMASNNLNFYAVDLRHQDIYRSTLHFIKTINPYLLLIFAKTTEMVESMANYLQKHEVSLVMLHGKMDQNQRKQS